MWIMESILIFLVVVLMSSPVLGVARSTSCSWVNGQMICQNQESQGNFAASAGQAAFGGGNTYQDVYAGAGNPGQWNDGRQTVYGNMAGPINGAPLAGDSSGAFSSSSSSSSDFIPGQAGGFGNGFAPVGGFPVAGGYPGQAAPGGYAIGGIMNPLGGGYAPQLPAGNPEVHMTNQGQAQGIEAQAFDPFMFVRPFMGGGAFHGAGAGAFAGPFAGGFAFGRR